MNNKIELTHFQIGAELASTIRNLTSHGTTKFERRDFVEPLIEYCIDGCYDGNIGIVYGLRSTGKSVGMLQTADELIQCGNKVAYARFDYKATGMKSVTEEMKSLISDGYTHFFVDEASYLNGFMNLAAEWSDRIVPGNSVKIVISGTDSFLLWLSEGSSLLHRHIEFSTNYTNFAEYKRVWGKGYDNYKTDGGFFAIGTTEKFIQQSVVENLLHTLDHCIDDANRRNVFTDVLYGISPAVVYKSVISILKCAAELSIKKHFQKYAGQRNISDLGTVIAGWNDNVKDDIKERIADEIDIYKDFQGVESPLNVIDGIMSFLVQIGCLAIGVSSMTGFTTVQKNYYFTQNALMSYSVQETINAAVKVEGLNHAKFQSAIAQAAAVAINETIVFTHLLYGAAPDSKVFKYQDDVGREIDAVVVNPVTKRMLLIEVKSKEKIDPHNVFIDEARHLYNTEVLENISASNYNTITRVVAYTGENRIIARSEGDLHLVNLVDLISNFKELDSYFDSL
jgi:predicted AAA+ superfamily ATPase